MKLTFGTPRVSPPPPVTARALAIMNTSIYNAWTAYDATAVPTQRTGWARRPAAEHAIEYNSMAISHAAHRALTNLFPSLADTFTGFRTALAYTMAPTGQPDDPATIGIQAADAVIAARTNDGANEAGGYADSTGYAPTSPPGPLTWQPLAGQSFAVPTGGRSPRSRSARPARSCPPDRASRRATGPRTRPSKTSSR